MEDWTGLRRSRGADAASSQPAPPRDRRDGKQGALKPAPPARPIARTSEGAAALRPSMLEHLAGASAIMTSMSMDAMRIFGDAANEPGEANPRGRDREQELSERCERCCERCYEGMRLWARLYMGTRPGE